MLKAHCAYVIFASIEKAPIRSCSTISNKVSTDVLAMPELFVLA